MHDWDDNPEVAAIRIQSMAEICARPEPESQLDAVVRLVKKGKRVLYDAPDGTVWRIKAKRVKK